MLQYILPLNLRQDVLQAQGAGIQCWVIGEPGAPAIGSLDPEPLIWIEENECLLVTRNYARMPVHLRNHLASGRHVPGILAMKSRLAPWQMVEELMLIWGASLPGEYHDQIVVWPRR